MDRLYLTDEASTFNDISEIMTTCLHVATNILYTRLIVKVIDPEERCLTVSVQLINIDSKWKKKKDLFFINKMTVKPLLFNVRCAGLYCVPGYIDVIPNDWQTL